MDLGRFNLCVGLGTVLFVGLMCVSFWLREHARRALFASLRGQGIDATIIDKITANRKCQIVVSDEPRAQTGLYCPRQGVALIAPEFLHATSARIVALLQHEMRHAQQHLRLGWVIWLFVLPQWLQVVSIVVIGAAGGLLGSMAAWVLGAVMALLYAGRFGCELDANAHALSDLRLHGASANDLRDARAQLRLGAASYAFGYLGAVTCIADLAWSTSAIHAALM